MKTLRDVAVGATVIGSKTARNGRGQAPYYGYGRHKRRDIYVRKVAPLGDPFEVTVRGYELSIRKSDAEMIEVS
jgi:ferrous iron transport protein A